MSSLTLERHFFTSINLQSNEGAKPGDSFNVRCNQNVRRATEDDRRFQVTVEVALEPKPDSESVPYYSGGVSVVGFFKVADDFDDPLRLVVVSGSSLLYAAARELICNLTARGPHPMVTLPTISFARPEPEGIAQDADLKRSPGQPRRRKK